MKYFLLAVSCCLFIASQAQSDCNVLLKELEGKYDGECKKGLANGSGKAEGTDSFVGEFKKGLPHGTGTYTWANGDVYQGEFEKGLKEGAGELKYTNNPDPLVGYWKEDEYIGKYRVPFEVSNKGAAMQRISISETKLQQEKAIEIFVNMDNQAVFNPYINITVLQGAFGYSQNTARSVYLTDISFPFKADLTFKGQKATVLINKEGMWKVTIEVKEQLLK
ncbi:MAG: hypothetical protein OEX02_10735 [Cyclobacteriaceae bacterium]|nr:hypothetical protein [Cyclobacteriaceae bacterium]